MAQTSPHHPWPTKTSKASTRKAAGWESEYFSRGSGGSEGTGEIPLEIGQLRSLKFNMEIIHSYPRHPGEYLLRLGVLGMFWGVQF